MNVLVCGLGSMGQRRIRLMQKYYGDDITIFGVDKNVERAEKVSKDYNIKVYDDISKAVAVNNIECAFVCASPIAHYPIIMDCLKNNLNIFTEINVISDGYDEILALAKEKNRKVFLSSTMNYRKDIQYIINESKRLNNPSKYIYHVGQYLPDWHPWENINDFFVTNKRTNGLREIMAIDMPWLLRAFGDVKDYHIFKNNISTMKLSFPDTCQIILEHENGCVGVLTFDIVARNAGRKFSLINEDKQISWSGTPDSLYDYDIINKKNIYIDTYSTHIEQDPRYASNIVENAYMDEIIAFFNYVINDVTPLYGWNDDYKTLKLIDDMEI